MISIQNETIENQDCIIKQQLEEILIIKKELQMIKKSINQFQEINKKQVKLENCLDSNTQLRHGPYERIRRNPLSNDHEKIRLNPLSNERFNSSIAFESKIRLAFGTPLIDISSENELNDIETKFNEIKENLVLNILLNNQKIILEKWSYTIIYPFEFSTLKKYILVRKIYAITTSYDKERAFSSAITKIDRILQTNVWNAEFEAEFMRAAFKSLLDVMKEKEFLKTYVNDDDFLDSILNIAFKFLQKLV